MMFEPGTQFARFKIISKLGEGGMGAVYLAEDQKLNRKVALKVVQSEFFDDPDRMARFTREAKTAAQISHPNVMAIHDLDKATDEASGKEINFIVMEYVEGTSLTEYLRTNNPALKDILRVSEKIAGGLAAAHKLGIVHRDIKTDNIMIDTDGEPRILDFGLAKAIDIGLGNDDVDSTNTTSQELTQEGKILGTVNYMSPEQARGEAVDSRSDIFAFGTMLYRMVTGVFPFEAKDRVSVLAKILEGRHQPIRQIVPSLPSELERIIDKCLQKDPRDRYQDTRDLVVDLRTLRRQYESGISDSISALQDKPTISRTFVFSGKKLLAVAALIVILISFAVWEFGGSSSQSGSSGLQAKENSVAVLGFENKTGDKELDWLEAGLPEILLTDLAQSGKVNLVGRNRIMDCLGDACGPDKNPSHQDWVKAARSLGATKILSGSFYKMGEQIRIDARLESIDDGTVIMGEKVVGSNPFDLVDSLTQKIATSLDVQDVFADNRSVSDLTSSNPKAYKEYILGMEKFNLFMQEEAVEHFEKAIELDSTFALPYMRIGMGWALQGRTQQGLPYLMKAKQYEAKLPTKDRNLLDAYYDLWVEGDYEQGMIKIKTFVDNYPDDKEARSFYAILLSVMTKDDEAALAQLDTVLMIDPRYPVAFTWYAQIYSRQEKYEEALKYILLKKKYFPESVEPMSSASRLYRMMGRYEESLKESRELLAKHPDEYSALSNMISVFLIEKQLDSAAYYNDMLYEIHGSDPYTAVGYYRIAANLEYWKGHFIKGLDTLKRGLDIILSSGDSSQIASWYQTLATNYEDLEMPDSAFKYLMEGYPWADRFSGIDYPIVLVRLSTANDSIAAPMLEKQINQFKVRVPQELWPLADLVEMGYRAVKNQDWDSVVVMMRKMDEEFNNAGTGTYIREGQLLVILNRFEEATVPLISVTETSEATSSGLYWVKARYWLGRAYEGLGQNDEAVAAYRDVIKYWDKADIQLEELKDSRQRLKKLAAS
ncbi:MAG TPA: protein kinase [candidate division Zixibacteria bacterium]|nr:protein kinase [candidate division Zixibacteria bacterium]